MIGGKGEVRAITEKKSSVAIKVGRFLVDGGHPELVPTMWIPVNPERLDFVYTSGLPKNKLREDYRNPTPDEIREIFLRRVK